MKITPQNGAAMLPKPRPSAADFIRRSLAANGSFRGDGKDHFYRAAVRIAAADPGLEIVDADSTIIQRGRARLIPGWELRRRPA